MLHEELHIAADLQTAVEEGSLGGDLASVDASGGGRVGADPHVGGVVIVADDVDLAVGDAHLPALGWIAFHDLFDDEGELGRSGLRPSVGLQLVEPGIGQERGHGTRLGLAAPAPDPVARRGQGWGSGVPLAVVDTLPTPASVRHRISARVVDAITLMWLLGFVLVEIDQRILGGDPFGRRPLQIDVTQGRSLVFVIVTIAAYEVVPTVWKGATLGKALLGLRLRTVEPTARVPWTRASARALVLYGAPVAFGAFGGIVVLALIASFVIPASGRGLHDRIAGSIVVALHREETP